MIRRSLVVLMLTTFACASRAPEKDSTSSPSTTRASAVECEKLAKETLVPLLDVDPTLKVDLRYATTRNFTHQVLYTSDVALLRDSVAMRLARVNARLHAKGLGLLVWDAYRPVSVQEAMWAIVHDERYVADPKKGSRHNRGAAVDVTLVDSAGHPLVMPTDHDEFSEKAHREFLDLPKEALANRKTLEDAMVAEGFVPLATEWWHFDDLNWECYPILGH